MEGLVPVKDPGAGGGIVVDKHSPVHFLISSSSGSIDFI